MKTFPYAVQCFRPSPDNDTGPDLVPVGSPAYFYARDLANKMAVHRTAENPGWTAVVYIPVLAYNAQVEVVESEVTGS